MDIIKGNKPTGRDKLEGEFRVPFSFGTGSNKSIWMSCINCGSPKSLSINTQGFICNKCNFYNGNRQMCIDRFEKDMSEGKLFNESGTHIRSEKTLEMIATRDTMEIRADLYKKGITKQTVGWMKYNSLMKKAMREAHVGKSRVKY